MTPLALQSWAARWRVHPEALADLLEIMGAGANAAPTVTPPPPGASEAWAQSVVRLEAPRFGVWLTRNNVGCLPDKRGVPVRYGLANESPGQNDVVKSGDLIGFRSVTVTAAMVGTVIGQFVSREMKPPGWRYTGKGREAAQMNWAALVNRYGGDAKFATGDGSFT